VQHLEGDRAALVVHRAGDVAMPHRLQARGHLRRERLEPAALVGRIPAGDDQADPATRTLGEVRRERRQVADAVLEPGVHRAHHHPVTQGEVAEGERLEQARVRRHPRH
jgi:hypothetical protein